jgi:hypothetical protein
MKLKLLNTGQEMSKALQAGEVEIIGSAYSNFPVAVERGMAAKGVVGLTGDRTGKYSDQAIAVITRKALTNMTFDARITPHTIAAWEENVRVLVEQKKLRAPLPWQQGVEPRFIEKVMKSHPQFFADLTPVK